MEKEIWKPIVGYEGLYEVSNLGNVKGLSKTVSYMRGKTQITFDTKETILKPLKRQHGYLSVFLYKKGQKREQKSIHRIVAEAFCEKHDGDTEVNHLNENKSDNRAKNLEWCGHKYNTNYGTAQLRRANKQINGVCSKAVVQYTLSGNFVKDYPSLAEAERQTGIQKSSICFALKGRYEHAGGYKWEYAKRGQTK